VGMRQCRAASERDWHTPNIPPPPNPLNRVRPRAHRDPQSALDNSRYCSAVRFVAPEQWAYRRSMALD
jgi:hypothetical protein